MTPPPGFVTATLAALPCMSLAPLAPFNVGRSAFDVFHFFDPLGPERVFVIIAAIQASDGKFYRYPMTIRFIQ